MTEGWGDRRRKSVAFYAIANRSSAVNATSERSNRYRESEFVIGQRVAYDNSPRENNPGEERISREMGTDRDNSRGHFSPRY